ncbi:hypothetical protein ABZ816_00720 [Actinosynnema sp. NPDC047251]|uniref:hypothetical protein n=1 Tax=Saccharothrix espanaensis TaxID=103731 RepID=UPI0006864434|nr:hypothetical protein [Saccharothrix espanaensis]
MRSVRQKLASVALAVVAVGVVSASTTGTAGAAARTYELEFCNYGSDYSAYLDFGDFTSTIQEPGGCWSATRPGSAKQTVRVVGSKFVAGSWKTCRSKALTLDGWDTYIEAKGKFPTSGCTIPVTID